MRIALTRCKKSSTTCTFEIGGAARFLGQTNAIATLSAGVNYGSLALCPRKISVAAVRLTIIFMPSFPKPTKAEIQAAYGKTVPDIIAPNLNVLFCGINPSIYSAAVGYHFARPGNRLWKTLYAAGFTPRLFHPSEDRELLSLGLGMTNIGDRATARADELSKEELLAGRQTLEQKIKHYRPKVLAILGITAYRTAFHQPKAVIGRQPHRLHDAILWVLPNPSGLNAHYQVDDLARVYAEMKKI